MIRHSVRCSLPFFLCAFVASAWCRLHPNWWSRWLLRNRRIFGLLFAFAMLWQALFIAQLFVVDAALFREIVLDPRFLLVDGLGYIFIGTMSVTSFNAIRRRMSPTTWKRLHKAGMYYLWLVLAGTYVYVTLLGQFQFSPVALAFVLALVLRIVAARHGHHQVRDAHSSRTLPTA
ncbi:MAG: hypothetical protein IPJ97_08620 [Proteobacteria bacterium]|nr:hypothetical protein [Pseudomonadota bacterium]